MHTPRAPQRAQGRPGGYRSLLLRQVDLLVPGLDEIAAAEPVAAPLALGWLFSLSAAAALRPIIFETMGADHVPAATALETWLWVAAALAPLAMAAKSVFLGALAWSVLTLRGTDRRFGAIVSVLLYGEVILAAQGVVLAIYLHLAGGAQGPDGFAPPLLLAGPAVGGAGMLTTAAQHLTLFHIAWSVFVWFCLRRVLSLGRRGATAMTAVFWVGTLATALLRTLLLR